MAKAKYLTYQEALARTKHYCAYQERCHQEVRYKLVALGVRGDDLEEMMTHLVQEAYLDETRYAKSYARGKLKNNGWGWIKIRQELKRREISEYNMQQAHQEISGVEYRQILQRILERKLAMMRDLTPFSQKGKLFNYAYGRGFETELVTEVLKELVH